MSDILLDEFEAICIKNFLNGNGSIEITSGEKFRIRKINRKHSEFDHIIFFIIEDNDSLSRGFSGRLFEDYFISIDKIREEKINLILE